MGREGLLGDDSGPLPVTGPSGSVSPGICDVARRRIDPTALACSGAGGSDVAPQPDGYFDRGYQRPFEANQSLSERSFQVTPLINQ